MRVAGVVSVVCLVVAAQAVRGEDGTRALMNRIVEPLVRVLPASLEEETFADPARREEIGAAVDELADAAAELGKHATKRDAGFRYLGGSLAQDAARTAERFARGEYPEARYALHQMTNTCIVCHSRLPSDRESPLADRLFARAEVAGLSVRQRARLQMATRRFDAALGSYEVLFADPESSPVTFDLGGDLLDYLTISLRVRRDVERPRAALARLSARPDVPHYMQRNLRAWLVALPEIQGQLQLAPTVGRARILIADGQKARGYAADRAGVIYDLAASSVLHRYLDSDPEPGAETAEALYLIGITDAWTQRSYWVSEAEFALKTAIRMAPREPVAREAYLLLEEYTVLGYSGSGGVNVPPDVQAELDELRALIDMPQVSR
jgi:hypothetical protein